MNRILLAFFVFQTLTTVFSLRVATLTDMHIDIKYKSDSAPLGKKGGDPPLATLEILLIQLKSQGPFDLILVPGDSVAHGVPLDPEKPGTGNYTLLKETIEQVFLTINRYFPDTYILFSLGNNDYKYHYQAPYSSEKSEFLTFVYDLQFKRLTKNQELLKNPDLIKTYMNGGYFRVDLNEKVSVISLNSLYYNKNNDPTKQQSEGIEQFLWFEEQLKQEAERKFIIMNHMYAGVKFTGKYNQLWDDKNLQTYVDILKANHQKVILEVGAHDHFADIRYHSDSLPQSGYSKAGFFFRNILIAPGITPRSGQNPGFATFEIEATTHIPHSLKMSFIVLDKTYGLTTIPPYSDISFNHVDFSNFGLKDLSGASLSEFKNKLEADDKLTLNYLVSKFGFNPFITSEYNKGLDLYTKDLNIITSKLKTYKFICQMHKNLFTSELDDCFKSNSIKQKFLD